MCLETFAIKRINKVLSEDRSENNMVEEKAKEIFEKYNRKSDVVRCPYGRSIVREEIDFYACVAVSLYGTISRTDFVDFFNEISIYKTNTEEVYILLLPLVLKNEWYCFYKDYIVHCSFFDDFSLADDIIELQDDKPRYIPEEAELIEHFSDDIQKVDENWMKVKLFMFKVFGIAPSVKECFENILFYNTLYGDGVKGLGLILDRYNLEFSNEDQMEEFVDLTLVAVNNTRMWGNNGYKPIELQEILEKRNKKIIKLPTTQKTKVGYKELCPCGSGKKYKYCCAISDNSNSESISAYLSYDECLLFCELLFGLLDFVNKKKNVIEVEINLFNISNISEDDYEKIRELLWKEPELIDEYINETELTQEKIDILKLWKTNHKNEPVFILEYQPEYAVAFIMDWGRKDIAYGIKGIGKPIEDVLQLELPLIVNAVLLPFKGKIVADYLTNPMNVGLNEKDAASLRRRYNKAKKRGIITSLE